MFGLTVRVLFVCAAFTAHNITALSQTPAADLARPVAKLTDHSGRTVTIRYGDVITQLALQPGTKIDPPSKGAMEYGLQFVLDQRILETPALEEAAAFGWQPSEKDIDQRVREITSFFPSPTDLAARIKQAGYYSLQDEKFRDVLTKRLFIDWYLDVHFRRQIRPTSEIEEKYYREIFIPEFRRSRPGSLIPTMDEVRRQISSTIVNEGSRIEIEKHLIRARQRVRIEIVEAALDSW